MNETSRISVLDAVVTCLQDAGAPLHYREITKRILARGLWRTKGKTPEATINAQLSVNIKKKGKASAFRRAGRGIFALNTERTDPVTQHQAMCRTEDRALYVRGPKAGEKLSFTGSACRILEACGGKPMHYRDITRHALEHEMLDTSGKTPEATMYAQILSEVKRRKGRGEQQRFMILGKGMITLAKWQAKGLAFQVEEANRKARKKLLTTVKGMSPGDFEDLIGRLLATIGFEEVEVTSLSKDGGIDVRGTLVVGDVIRTRLAVQVKRWKQNVQAPVIQQVRGSLGAHEQGLIISTSDFSKGAKQEAERPDATPVALMNGEQLVALLVEHEIGVRRTAFSLIEMGEDEGEPHESD
ncbi:MAG: restriction endonuclease [Verrucomicrobia bacterium]|nr:restriction endonuclease [Verrucomicrobiota bacterium]